MAGGKGRGLTVGKAAEERCTETADDAEGGDEGEQQTSRGQGEQSGPGEPTGQAEKLTRDEQQMS